MDVGSVRPTQRGHVRIAWLAVGWLAAVVLLVVRVVQVTSASVYGNDLRVFWSAGHAAVHGGDPWVRGFDYLPASLAIFAPLGALPFGTARVVWLVGSLVLLVGTAIVLARRLGVPVPAVVFVTFAIFPTVSTLEFANATVVELPLLVALTVAVDKERWWRATAIGVVALVVKPVLVPCLLVFLLRRRWRELAVLVGTLALLSAAALAIVGDARGWYAEARSALRVAGDDPHSAALGALVGRHELPTIVAVLVGALVIVVGLAVFFRSRTTVVVLSAPLLVSFLVGPVCWAHYPLLLLPLAGWLVTSGRRVSRVSGGVALVLLASPEVVHLGLLAAVPPAPLFALITVALGLLLAGSAFTVQRTGPRRQRAIPFPTR